MANQQTNDNRQPPQPQQAGPRDLNQKTQGSPRQADKKQGGETPQRRDSKH
ncbi:hypothetical protein LJR219_001229 [Phenylobacterium sp. LjRoot219]|uniref:hypothetical protein n=1 Tax=Phenylobacterium sp. LjRoot219 TaxID=3342283 RepID=UPI003ECEB5BE